MFAYYGYADGSGSYFITVDTDRCDGCGDCAKACPKGVFEVVDEDPYDPFRETPVVVARQDKRNRLEHECGLCKPAAGGAPPACVTACDARAISHSW